MASEESDGGVETEQRAAQPVVSIRATIPTAELGETVGDRLQALRAFVAAGRAAPAGPPFVRYHTFGEVETDMELGVPVAEPVTGEGRITGGELPGGPAITTWHDGAHDRLGEAYARIESWLDRHGKQRRGPGWEVYHWIDLTEGEFGPPDPVTSRTRLVQPIA